MDVSDIVHVALLRKQAEQLKLHGWERLSAYSNFELALIYSGIGPDYFSEDIRNAITKLNKVFEPAALIHDVCYYESDGTRASFKKANREFKLNGYTIADHCYAWYNPFRYLRRLTAHSFASLCDKYGWKAWMQYAPRAT